MIDAKPRDALEQAFWDAAFLAVYSREIDGDGTTCLLATCAAYACEALAERRRWAFIEREEDCETV